jgi:hypothetical protein
MPEDSVTAKKRNRRTALEDLMKSQAVETALYEVLENADMSDRADIVRQINAQAAVRTAAYNELAKDHVDQNKNISLLTEATAQQVEALKLIEHQLNSSKAKFTDQRLEALKMVDITSYSGKQYQAYANFLASVVAVFVLFLMSKWAVPRLADRGVPFTPWLPRLVLLGGVIYIITRGFDLLLRRNDHFDEYIWPTAPRTEEDLADANLESQNFIKLENIPTLCAGSFCCAEGTEWVDSSGCVVSASSPPTKHPTLDGQELTATT